MDDYEKHIAPEKGEEKLIDQFYADPDVFENWIADALTQHKPEQMFIIQAHLGSIRDANMLGSEERAKRVFGNYMYELINNYMEDASVRRERGEC